MPDLPIVKILKAVADGTRLRVLVSLLQEPATQKELGAEVGLPSGTMSRHLGELERIELIARQRKHGPYHVVHPDETRTLIQIAASLARATTSESSRLALDMERAVRRTGMRVVDEKGKGS